MINRAELTRVTQLTSTYAPEEPPRLPMDFGDYLSLLWRLDKHTDQPNKIRYYRQCALSLAGGLGMQDRSIVRLIELTSPGELYKNLANAPYRGTNRLVDAADRKAAIVQLAQLRADILRIGTYQDQWPVSWPGSGIQDTELRDRVFAVLFTALQGQYGSFGRLLLVVDIVMADLLLGIQPAREIMVSRLVSEFGYPDPNDERVRLDYNNDTAR